jgi:putative ABC transport system substrate-binding protein
MIRRREFITALGGTAAWPLAVRGQQSVMPVIGLLAYGSIESRRAAIEALLRGLSAAGYVENRNFTVEYALSDDYLQLPALAGQLVRHRVATIVALTTPAAVAAKAATSSIPVVFSIGADPVDSRLVVSLNRPGGNLTGIFNFATEVAAKRLQLLHELVPDAKSIGYLVNPTNRIDTETETKALQAAANTIGVQLPVLTASDPSGIEAAFTMLTRDGVGALVLGSDAFFGLHRNQTAALAARYAIAAIYSSRADAEAGGLMSYGTEFSDVYRRIGGYTGRILRGEQAADLPVQQVTTIELVINMKAAKALGLTVPLPLRGRADELIE